MQSIELELTYLVKSLPQDLAVFPHLKMLDVYIPASADHPVLRLRQAGERFEITKKLMAAGNDSSHMIEQTIQLDKQEFLALSEHGKRVEKTRYRYPYEGREVEFDIFGGELAGLVIADIEFEDREDQLSFAMPAFCLADVTQEAFVAGGVLAGKRYGDIEPMLNKYGYKALSMER